MDVFDKYALVAGRHGKVLQAGADPFGVCVDELLSATRGRVNGRDTILVGTNNYLGLTLDPECMEAAAAAIREHGTGTTGSRIANGTYAMHRGLEHEIAAFMRRRSALVFPTGYQANLGMLAGLAGPRDVILLDADSHSSIYDGCRLSGATVVRFRHNDADDLDRRLTRLADQGECKLIVVEGIYSMLGDQAPLAEFAEVKARHGAFLLVDEAHSVGVLGNNGRGAAEEQGVEAAVDFVAGTFSKSLGAVGGFVASDHPKFEVLRFCCRQYMFTASSCPSSIASVRAAFRRIREEPELRQRLWANAGALYDGLTALGFAVCSAKSPIIAVRLPDERTALWAWNRLLEHGVYVNLALPPGTPNGVCLLRCSVSAAHTSDEITEVCRRFGRVAAALHGGRPEEAQLAAHG
ncbi:MAG: serine palmitoyltransferase [Geminicoccaceae bacterium]